jgi:hypothetical protein
MAASGARYAAQGKAAGGKRGATGMRIPGMGLSDHVPVGGLAAPGELIVNRHTERRVDNVLNRIGTSLGSLVAGETKPHAEPLFATGGRAESVGHAAGGRHGGATGLSAGIQGAVNRVIGQFPGLTVTSTTGGGHAANSYHYRGMAADLGGDAATMLRAASWIKRTMGSNLTDGIHNPNLSIKGGCNVPAEAAQVAATTPAAATSRRGCRRRCGSPATTAPATSPRCASWRWASPAATRTSGSRFGT